MAGLLFVCSVGCLVMQCCKKVTVTQKEGCGFEYSVHIAINKH
jgi:hypothetical protein